MSLSSKHKHKFDVIIYIDPFWNSTENRYFLVVCSKCGAMVWCNYRRVFRDKKSPKNVPFTGYHLLRSINEYWFSDTDYPHISKKSLDEWKDATYNILVEEMGI